MRFKLREEKNGALLFDNLFGNVSKLSEEKYLEFLKSNEDFKLYKSYISRNDLPSDCLSFPSKIYFELTRKCNLNCKNCYNKSSRPFENELGTDEILKLIKEFSDKGCFELRLTGGEPTVHPDFFKITKYAKSQGLFLSLGTNGVWNETFAKKIRDAGFNIIILSLEGPQVINDEIRGDETFNKIIRSLNILKENNDLILKLNMTLSKKNKEYLEDVVEIASKNGVKVVNIAPLRIIGRASEKESQTLTPEEFYEIAKKIIILRKKYNIKIQTYFDILEPCKTYSSSLINDKSCAAGIEVAVINPEGNVYGCAVSLAGSPEKIPGKELFTAGNIREENFEKIWLDSNKWKAYRNILDNKSEKCKQCKHYGSSCFGNCFVSSYLHFGKLNAIDPYCFADLMKGEN
ncbi:MAG: radical SAM protein [Candidatus Nanoarchaeia archaeon]|nr:radical SAM protein [Candidatus Nanoarchaeia archaeon]